MKLFNTLTRKLEAFVPLDGNNVRMYSCGPTVYDHIHIGNLRAFIAADTLRRVLSHSGLNVRHVMNFTDVDDKTIHRSAERYPEESPETALKKLTDEYKRIFLEEMNAIGNDIESIEFVSATDSIEGIRALITELYNDGFAYIADDGVYFSIEKYRASGKTYGQLLNLDIRNKSLSRINNDEYDKESINDFALWKSRTGDEPAWPFELDGHNLLGRPGWHIECSVMSVQSLGQPFDIHTGGVDLIFPHHENEIAQSTAGKGELLARYFVHNEHLLVDGKKMSKSLNNFFTLRDIRERGYDPLAFRLMMLQSHYRNQNNFTWENLEAAQNRLRNWYAAADRIWQLEQRNDQPSLKSMSLLLEEDLSTPETLSLIDETFDKAEKEEKAVSTALLDFINLTLGVNLTRGGITDDQKQLITDRQKARRNNDWAASDTLRARLSEQGIGVRDTNRGQIWYRL